MQFKALTFLFLSVPSSAQSTAAHYHSDILCPEPQPTARPRKACYFPNAAVRAEAGLYHFEVKTPLMQGQKFYDAASFLPSIETTALKLHDYAARVKDPYSMLLLNNAVTRALDINATNAEGKTALNVLVESLFHEDLAKQIVNEQTFKRGKFVMAQRLHAIDFILANGADPAGLTAVPSTKTILDRAKSAYVEMQASQKRDFSSIRLHGLAYAYLKQLLKMTGKISDLQTECNVLINRQPTPSNPVLILADNHHDAGRNLFLEKSLKLLKTNGVDEVCIEFDDGLNIETLAAWLKNLSSRNTATQSFPLEALRRQFSVRLADVGELGLTASGKFDIALVESSKMFGPSSHLRDKGFQLYGMMSALRTNGKTSVILGTAHIPQLISFFAYNGIKTISVYPHVGPFAAEKIIGEDQNIKLVVNEKEFVKMGDIIDLYLDKTKPAQSQQLLADFHKMLEDAYKPEQPAQKNANLI